VTDYGWVLTRTHPNNKWRVGTEYSSLEWLDDAPKPSQKELDDAQPILLAQENASKEAQKLARQAVLDKLGLTADEAQALLG